MAVAVKDGVAPSGDGKQRLGIFDCDLHNAMPSRDTLKAFMDHGVLRRTVDADPAAAVATLAKLKDVGIDMEDVEQTLEDEGVNSFSKSFDELLQSLSDKAATFT